MNIGILPNFGLAPAHSLLFKAWNALPHLQSDGPVFLIVPITDGAHWPTIQALLRALAVEHAAREANHYWCCALNDDADSTTNEALLDLLAKHETSPEVPYLWIPFAQCAERETGASLRRIATVTSACERRVWGTKALEKRDRAGNIGRRLGEAFGLSAFDFGVDAAAGHGLLSEANRVGIQRFNSVSDTFEGTLEFLEKITGAEDAEALPVECYDRLAGRCFKILSSLRFAASPKSCGAVGDAALVWADGERKLPLIVTVEAIDTQGVECLTFLASLIVTCADAPWPVLIVATAADHARARLVVEGSLHRTAATQQRLERRVFEGPGSASVESDPLNGAATSADDLLDRFQALATDVTGYLNDTEASGAPGAAATALIRRGLDLRNELASLWAVNPDPSFLDMAFGLVGICLTLQDLSDEPAYQRLAFLESLSSDISAYVDALLARDFRPTMAKAIFDVEIGRLESLNGFYRDFYDMKNLRPLFADNGPVCALVKVAEKYDLPLMPLWGMVESYLNDVSRLRASASKSAEQRFATLRRKVGKGAPSLEEALESRHFLRRGQAQYYLGRFEESVESFKLAISRYRRAGSEAPEGDEAGGARHNLAIKLLKRTEQLMLDKEKELAGGGMIKESLKLIGDLWGRR